MLKCEQCGGERTSLACVDQEGFGDMRSICDTCFYEIGLRGQLLTAGGVPVSRSEFLADLGPVVTLRCCCCMEPTQGRQWHNRDEGYGLCDGCVTLCYRGTTNQEFESCYGVRGVHCGVMVE